MKIIKQGALAANAIYRCTCMSCRTEYEFERREARLTSDQREGDALITTCPTPDCNNQNWTAVRGNSGQFDR